MKRALGIYMIWMMLLLPAMADEEVSLFSPGSMPAQAVSQTEAPVVLQPDDNLPQVRIEEVLAVPEEETTEPSLAADSGARDEFIDGMIALAEEIYQKTNGRAQPANSSGDIYVCKNFTVHLFRKNRDNYRMSEFPDVPLVIPNNLPAKESKPYSYGISWEEVTAQAGNPFVVAAQFFYNADESKEKNMERAMDFMKQVKRGDFFQMSADYYYGIGAHSLVFTQDYDPDTGTVTWTDSNMKGEKRDGKRYGYVQFDAKKDIEWFVDAFCTKGRGATLYRLRDDIIKR